MDAGLRAAGRDPGQPGAGMAGHFDSPRRNLIRHVPAGEHAVVALSSTCTMVADKQTKLDLPAALRGADLAEGYAVSAVDFALAAIDEAKYAILDALLA
jgi:hypothetical protein